MQNVWNFDTIRQFMSPWIMRGLWLIWDPFYGDGGKAKIVDFLTSIVEFLVACGHIEVGAVVRFQGGDNAGHTIVIGGDEHATHYIPAGVFQPREKSVKSVMGRGMAINLTRLFKEMDGFIEKGIPISPDNLLISEGIHLTLAHHMALELAREKSQGKMETTAKGISMTYGLKHFYQGLRAGEIRNMDFARKLIQPSLLWVNGILSEVYGEEKVSEDKVMAEIEAYRDRLLPFLGNEAVFLHGLLTQGKVVIGEGAQSGLLDIDAGIYPYTTSSNTLPASIQQGCGVDPRWITRSIAVAKAYISRVGIGPLVSEMPKALGDQIREVGNEYGTTTGRPRRMAWLDDTIGKKWLIEAPPTELVITKPDILTGFPLQICTSYKKGSETIDRFPSTINELMACEPILKDVPGWNQSINGVTDWDSLPKEAQSYIKQAAEPFGCPISMIGTGQERKDLIVFDPPMSV